MDSRRSFQTAFDQSHAQKRRPKERPFIALIFSLGPRRHRSSPAFPHAEHPVYRNLKPVRYSQAELNAAVLKAYLRGTLSGQVHRGSGRLQNRVQSEELDRAGGDGLRHAHHGADGRGRSAGPGDFRRAQPPPQTGSINPAFMNWQVKDEKGASNQSPSRVPGDRRDFAGPIGFRLPLSNRLCHFFREGP